MNVSTSRLESIIKALPHPSEIPDPFYHVWIEEYDRGKFKNAYSSDQRGEKSCLLL